MAGSSFTIKAEYERQDVVLEPGRIHLPADDTRVFPGPGLENRKIKFHKRIQGGECREAGGACIVESEEGFEPTFG